MLQKPFTCDGCSLAERGRGYAPPTGPANSPILFVGEALGDQEVHQGEPFVGPAGAVLNRLLARTRQSRQSFRIDNVVRCCPPNNWFDPRAPWYFTAREHCTTRHLNETLAEGHRVVVPLGGTALRYLLRMDKDVKVEDWHGTVTRDPSDRFWLVPTFHPSFLQRGAMSLFGVAAFDLQQALRVAAEGHVQETPDIIVDPTIEWFTWWVGVVEAASAQDPLGIWLAVDIETPDKSAGQDEGELSPDDRSYQIVRVNFSVHPDEGVTVPYAGPYIPLIERLLKLACPKLLWAKEYDEPRLRAAGHSHGGDWLDFMWAWHRLQSDVRRGLGFVAPMYSRFGAWKHLAQQHPGYYAACDGFQTYRVATGIARDLTTLGMWDVFARHTHAVYKLALKPAQEVGVKIHRERLTLFIADLEVKQRRLLHEMQGLVPEELRPLTPKGGLKHPPGDGVVHTKGRKEKKDGTLKKEEPDPIKQDLYAQVAVVVKRDSPQVVRVCLRCHAVDVQRQHRCEAPAGNATDARPVYPVLSDYALESRVVTRYFWQEPFNPDSPSQILAYLKAKGHKPGRAKKTGHDSTDRETLQRLVKETKDPLYGAILKSRAVGKVKGTYGVGTLKRMDGEDRVHPVPTDKPTTGRRSYINPNITNVIADKGGKDNLAAGFRNCVVGATEDPAWATPNWAARYD